VNRRIREALMAAIALPVAVALSCMPSAAAATVLIAEGVAQQKGSAQRAFNGEFCAQNSCRSISTGPLDIKTSSQRIQTAVTGTPGDIIVVGYSLGAAAMYDRMRQWDKNPGLAPDPERVVLIVTFGNPENKFGGDSRTDPGTGLPPNQPYQHLDVTMQYDSVADKPTRWGYYSMINASFARHLAYFEDVDINDPDNLIYEENGTTYMLVPADVLPMLQWRAAFTSPQRMAELDAQYRPLVERDYDRPDYVPQGDGADWGAGNPPPAVPAVSEVGGGANRRSVDTEGRTAVTGLPPTTASSASARSVTEGDGDGDEQDPQTSEDADEGETTTERESAAENESETPSARDHDADDGADDDHDADDGADDASSDDASDPA